MREKDIYEAMNQGVLLCNEKSRILYFNSSYSRFIGYCLEEVCGKTINHTFGAGLEIQGPLF